MVVRLLTTIPQEAALSSWKASWKQNLHNLAQQASWNVIGFELYRNIEQWKQHHLVAIYATYNNSYSFIIQFLGKMCFS